MSPPTLSVDSVPEAQARMLRRALTELVRVHCFRNRDRLCGYDLSVTQSHALDALSARGPLSLNELAADLYLDKSTTCRVVDGLEKKGYVERRRHPENRRSVLVVVTEPGAALQVLVERDGLEEDMALLEEFDPEIQEGLLRLLKRLVRAAASRVDTHGGSCCAAR